MFNKLSNPKHHSLWDSKKPICYLVYTSFSEDELQKRYGTETGFPEYLALVKNNFMYKGHLDLTTMNASQLCDETELMHLMQESYRNNHWDKRQLPDKIVRQVVQINLPKEKVQPILQANKCTPFSLDQHADHVRAYSLTAETTWQHLATNYLGDFVDKSTPSRNTSFIMM